MFIFKIGFFSIFICFFIKEIIIKTFFYLHKFVTNILQKISITNSANSLYLVEEQPALKAEILKWKVEQREKQKAEKEIRLSKEKIEVERMEEDIEEEILD
jgi:hypothetical protein